MLLLLLLHLLWLRRGGTNLDGGAESQYRRPVSRVERGGTVFCSGFKEKLRGPVLVDDNIARELNLL